MRAAVKQQLQLKIENQQLTEITSNSDNTIYIDPELLESRAPRSQARVRILSPFDNAIIQRQRGREIFNFDYQIECYLPEPKRQFGYFCLPIIYRDGFVGRMDCKAHRASNLLEIKSMHIEQPVDKNFISACCREIQLFAKFNGCEQVSIRAASPHNFLAAIRAGL